MKKPFTRISAVLFLLVALAHLWRLLFHVPVTVGGTAIPFAVSIGGLIVPVILAVMLWREAAADCGH
jgi:hypothetical protein